MEIKVYKKENDYSYSLGAFPTIELLKNKEYEVIKVLLHSSFINNDVINIIKDNLDDINKLQVNDKLVMKLSDKGNCFIVGVFKKREMILDSNKDHLLLDNPSNMGNLGTIIRSSLGFNIFNIAIIKPGVDIFDPKVIRSSMGSLFNVNIEYFNTIEEYKMKYNKHTLYSFMLKAKKSLREQTFDKELVTLAFGNEATGLDDSYLDENSTIIYHNDKIDSLNITNAVSIALYEYNEKRKLINRK